MIHGRGPHRGPPLVFPSLDQRSARGVAAAAESAAGAAISARDEARTPLERPDGGAGTACCVACVTPWRMAAAQRFSSASKQLPGHPSPASSLVSVSRPNCLRRAHTRQILCAGTKPAELYGKITWKIDKFSQISKRELRSDTFDAGNYKWCATFAVAPQHTDRASAHRQRGALSPWCALTLQHQDSAMVANAVPSSQCTKIVGGCAQSIFPTFAGTSWCTPRAATCATTCHCSSASPTTTSCCPGGATSRSSPSPS